MQVKVCAVTPNQEEWEMSEGPRQKFLKLRDIVRTAGGDGMLPISTSKWYAGIKEGLFPEGYKLGGITVWLADDIEQLAEGILQGKFDTSTRVAPKNRAMLDRERELAKAS